MCMGCWWLCISQASLSPIPVQPGVLRPWSPLCSINSSLNLSQEKVPHFSPFFTIHRWFRNLKQANPLNHEFISLLIVFFLMFVEYQPSWGFLHWFQITGLYSCRGNSVQGEEIVPRLSEAWTETIAVATCASSWVFFHSIQGYVYF